MLLAYAFIATFPSPYGHVVGPGVDASWIYAINLLPHTGFEFGRDVVFTYGPLGHLLVATTVGSNLAHAALAWFGVHVMTFWLVVNRFRRDGQVLAPVGFAIGLILARTFGLAFEYQVFVLLGLLLSVPPQTRTWRWAAPVAGGLSAILLFAKFTIGIAALVMLVGRCVLARFVERSLYRRVIAWLGLSYLSFLVVAALFIFPSPRDVANWFGGSFEITRGFPLAMALPQPTIVLLFAVSAVLVYVGVLFVLPSRPSELLVPAAILLAPILLSLRHSFVRAFGAYVFSSIIAALAVVISTARSRRAVGYAALSIIIVVAIAGVAATRVDCACPWHPGRLLPAQGLDNLTGLLRLSEIQHTMRRQASRDLEVDRLPDEWVAVMERSGSVDSIPWEVAFLPANGLQWAPSPVIQSYVAYTQSLDSRMAGHFSDGSAPEHLLVQMPPLDGGHQMLRSPSMWRAIMSTYRSASPLPAPAPDGEVVLLERRPEPVGIAPLLVGGRRAEFDEWIRVFPRTDMLVYAYMDFDLSGSGLLAETFWRIEQLFVDLRFADGRVVRSAFLPATSGNGLLVNHLPQDVRELALFLDGHLLPEITHFRVHGPGRSSFESSFDIVWRAAAWSPEPSPGVLSNTD